MAPRLDYGRRVIRARDLAVLCWCEADIVHAAPEVVRACRTESCGRPGCEPPAGEVRA